MKNNRNPCTSDRISMVFFASFLLALVVGASSSVDAQTLQNVIWTNAVGVSVSGNNLTKTAASGWGNAGAASTQTISSGDGYVEFTASEVTTYRMLGLSKGDTDQNYTDIDFAIFPTASASNNVLQVYESGTYRGDFGTYTTGDVLRVAVESGIVKYRKNGTLLYTSTVAPSYPLLVDAALYSQGGTLNNVVISSGSASPQPQGGPWMAGAAGAIYYNGGNVGIGTTTPVEKLEVSGNIKLSGNINVKYQDVAEWVASSQSLEPGTVVVLDSIKSNQVVVSTHRYDSRVAGVVSLKPGLALGEESEGRVLVATTGRVRVKVDASNGPIRIGDLLVTSGVPGIAMKSFPVSIAGVQIHRPGTLIGKALEPLAKGRGEILVLLSLQ